jgi:plastocyanin domain-containing protein
LDEGAQVVLTGGTYLKEGDTVADLRDGTPKGVAKADTEPAPGTASNNGIQTAAVTVTERGFEPVTVTLQAGIPARITFTRTSDKTCGTEVIFADNSINKPLPLNQPVTVEFTPKKGEIGFACGMNMLKGKVVAR